MTILDDARAGMNPDIRIQDDLFGHVNGAWLDTAEIPNDRSSWGPFVMLADTAEEHVREIIEAAASGKLEGDTAESADEARKIGDLFASFMDEERVEQLGHTPILPLLEEIDALTDLAGLAAFLGSFERRGGSGLFGSYVDTDARNSDRYVVNVVQGGIGLPDESYYRDEKFAEIREKYVAYLGRMLTLAERPDPEGTAARVLELETRLAKGHWERAETRDVIKTYNLMTIDELRAAAAELRLRHVDHRPRRRGRHDRRDGGPAAVLPRAPRDGPRRHPDRGLAGLLVGARDPHGCGVPLGCVRRGQLRLLRPHPLRHPRAARPVEARRLPGRGLPRRGRRVGSTSPGTSRRARRR